MDVIISSLGFRHSAELEEFIKEKLSKIEHLAPGLVRVKVTLSQGAEGDPEGNFTEMRLEMPGNDPFVKKQADSFEASVTECTDALQTMLRRQKEKLTDRQQKI